MAGLTERYDSALIGILQSEGQILKFLDVVYGFLFRKTDFYMIMKEKNAKMGFPEGVALKLTLGAFKKYEALAAQNEERRLKQAGTLKRNATDEKQRNQDKHTQKKLDSENRDQSQGDPGVQKETVESTETKPNTAKPFLAEEKPKKAIPSVHDDVSVQPEEANMEAPKPAKVDENKGSSGKKSDDDDPELTAQQKKFQANPESYNGAQRDNYCWSQSATDVDARIQVPRWVRKGRDVKVDIGKKYLKVCHKDKDGAFVTVIDEPLTWDINKEESMWSLVPGEHVHVNLEKIQERWWEGLLESEPKISVRKIDPSKPMTDLDDEAQAKIEEMMYNEHQKRMGKPQSHEMKVQEMLKGAWDLEGSPFKGQPFDPSLVNIQNPGKLNMGRGCSPAGPS